MPEHPRKRRRAGRIVLAVLSVLLFVLGAVILIALTLFPTETERIVGQVKVEVQQAVAGEQMQTITLGPEGGKRALDNAEFGSFVEMVDYRMEGVPAVYAAHNNRGGDVILAWEMGQEIRVVDSETGTEGIYVVAEERFTKKWSNIDELVGMRGPITVQTCYYGENRMRFLSLVPLAEWEAEQATTADEP